MQKFDLQARFWDFIASQISNPADTHFLLAVSGGVDSMVMLQLFMQSNLQFSVAHCNFSLRGKESDADQELLERYAEQHNLQLFKKRFNTKYVAQEKKISVQLAARQLRYSWFSQLMEEQHFHRLATAHHLDDDIETFFINLNRGTGMQGLSGIPASTDKIIRPLIRFSKEEIYQFAEEQDIPFREDRSNLADNYLRNWLRIKILPLWKKRNPQFQQVMQKSIEIISRQNSLYKNWAAKETTAIRKQVEKGKVNITDITNLPDPALLLFDLLTPFGFSFPDIEQLCHLLQSENTGKQIRSEDYSILIDRQQIFLRKNVSGEQQIFEIENFDDTTHLPFTLQIQNYVKEDLFQLKQKMNIFQADADKINFPLLLRKWQKGDRFTPIGMKGSKKVSDFLIDEKIPMAEKENTFVLLSAGKIIWIVGKRISEHVKVSSATRQVLEIKIEG